MAHFILAGLNTRPPQLRCRPRKNNEGCSEIFVRFHSVACKRLCKCLSTTASYFLPITTTGDTETGFASISEDCPKLINIHCRGVGASFFTVALLRFRKAVTQTQV
jgi:hypothetical protein